jgi:hypothetical protein
MNQNYRKILIHEIDYESNPIHFISFHSIQYQLFPLRLRHVSLSDGR